MKKIYTFKTIIWLYPGNASWHFITLPKNIAKNIDFYFSLSKRGFGSLPVLVTVGKTTWKTSIFPDKKEKSYILPLKAEIRKKESIRDGDLITLSLKIKG